jgi:hypothetical protein
VSKGRWCLSDFQNFDFGTEDAESNSKQSGVDGRLQRRVVGVELRCESGAICIDNVGGNCDWCNEVLLE